MLRVSPRETADIFGEAVSRRASGHTGESSDIDRQALPLIAHVEWRHPFSAPGHSDAEPWVDPFEFARSPGSLPIPAVREEQREGETLHLRFLGPCTCDAKDWFEWDEGDPPEEGGVAGGGGEEEAAPVEAEAGPEEAVAVEPELGDDAEVDPDADGVPPVEN